jgi:hypothetical protein
MPPTRELPDIAKVLAPLLERVAEEQRPLLIALAERMAAQRYRGWADASPDADQRDRLLACAEREEEIAGRVEALFPDAAAIQQDLRAKNPQLEDINRSIFAPLPHDDQLTLQSRGERLGAATWRSLAKRAASENEREVYLGCAKLEEESAVVLESILGLPGPVR